MKDNLRRDRALVIPPVPGAIKRISWGAVFAGVVVAMVLQLTLSLLGIGIGVGTIDPMEEQNPMSGLGTGALIWWIVSMLLSLFAGGWVAGRLAGMSTTFDSVLHGIITWSLFALLTFYLLTTALGRVVSGVGGVVGQTLSLASRGIEAAAPQVVEAVQEELEARGITTEKLKQEVRVILQQTGKPELQPENLEQEARRAARAAQQGAGEMAADPQAAGTTFDEVMDQLYGRGQEVASAADREAAVNVIMKRTGKSRAEASEIVDSWVNTYERAKAQYKETRAKVGQRARVVGSDLASAVSKVAIYAFFGLLLGAIAAAVGGKLGEPHDVPVIGGPPIDRV